MSEENKAPSLGTRFGFRFDSSPAEYPLPGTPFLLFVRFVPGDLRRALKMRGARFGYGGVLSGHFSVIGISLSTGNGIS